MPCEPFSDDSKHPPLNLVEQRTQFSIWCIWGAPLIIGSDLRKITKEALNILVNKEAIKSKFFCAPPASKCSGPLLKTTFSHILLQSIRIRLFRGPPSSAARRKKCRYGCAC